MLCGVSVFSKVLVYFPLWFSLVISMLLEILLWKHPRNTCFPSVLFRERKQWEVFSSFLLPKTKSRKT